jgi:ribosomal protein L19
MNKSLFLNKISVYNKEITYPESGQIVLIKFLNIFPNKFKIILTSQIFLGVCISLKKKGILTSIILRNIHNREGVEHNFFLHSPLINSIKIFAVKKNMSKKNKLYFLRQKPVRFSKVSVS